MIVDLQKANLGKRIIAAIFDGILLSILAVGLAALFSIALGYDGYIDSVNASYEKYESMYDVEFQISQQAYEELSEQQRQNYDTAYQALITDESVTYAYNMLINLTMLIMTFAILISIIVIEFVVPLLFGNGQTLGKKIFGIGLMHVEGIRVNNLQLFARTLLGKFAIELMIPLHIIIMIFFNFIGIVGLAIMLILLIVQVVCLVVTHTNSLIHDVLAGTVAVDISSQKIFRSKEELLEYTKKIHAERAARATY